MKGVLACFAFLGLLGAPALAGQTEVGAGIILVSGTHTENTGARANPSLVPAPLIHLLHRTGRFEFQLDAIPPEKAPIGSNSLGLRSTSLSYLNGTMRYRVAPMTQIGLSEMAYNQESYYEADFPQNTVPGTLASFHHTDRSRVVGLAFSLTQTLHATSRSSLSASLALSPSLHGALGVHHGWTTVGTPIATDAGWSSASESGAQLDAIVENVVRTQKRASVHYGLRYLVMNMHFPSGYTADRNAFVIPFFGWSTTLGN